jgi:dihydrofolate synthase/folylpolyglutamate synthase
VTDAERRLLDLPRFADAGAAAYRPGLGRVRAVLGALGSPERRYPAVHVAGTNGKGSTASLVAAVASAAGLRVGLHTSPHLLTLRERMRVDGEPAPGAWLDGALDRFGGVFGEVGASFFEATVALSLLYFAERRVDLAVVEVGLGGRLDATNVLRPAVCAVTHVGLDHTELLGGTVEEIAREKGGIAKHGVPFLHAVTGQSAGALETEAERRGAPVEAVRQSCVAETDAPPRVRLVTPARDYGVVGVGLPGAHQAWNAALAVRAAETALPGLAAEAVRTGLRDVVPLSGLRGRGEPLAADPRVVLDVAHNADGWRAALDALRLPPGGRLTVLAGVLADKDAGALGGLLADRDATAWAVGVGGGRGRPAGALARALRPRAAVEEQPDVAAALRAFRQSAGPCDRLLVTGSHVVVAEALDAAARTTGGPAG